jgi:hypothetical protein
MDEFTCLLPKARPHLVARRRGKTTKQSIFKLSRLGQKGARAREITANIALALGLWEMRGGTGDANYKCR